MLNNQTGFDVIQPTGERREIVNCQSIQALAAFNESRKQHSNTSAGDDSRQSTEGRKRDTDGLTFKAAMDIAKAGGVWEHGALDMQKINIPQAITQRPKPRRRMQNNMVGFLPNVGAHLAGQPLAMLNLPKQPKQAKIIKVGVHVGRIWGTEQNQVFNRAAAIIAVIDELTLQGYAVEVWAVWRNEGSNTSVEINTLIKPTTAPWQPSTVAFALGNLAFQRRLCWGAAERLEVGHKIAGGYGNGVGARRDDMDVFYPYVVDGDQFDSPSRAYDTIKKTTDEEMKQANAA